DLRCLWCCRAAGKTSASRRCCLRPSRSALSICLTTWRARRGARAGPPPLQRFLQNFPDITNSNCWSRARRATLRRVQLTGNGLVVEAEPLPGAASAEYLTAALRRSDVLREGCVDKVRLESSRPTLLSRIIRLSLTYDRTVD